MSQHTATAVGRPEAFALAVGTVALWALVGRSPMRRLTAARSIRPPLWFISSSITGMNSEYVVRFETLALSRLTNWVMHASAFVGVV